MPGNGRRSPSGPDARESLATVRAEFSWLANAGTTLARARDGRLVWWTFGSLFANAALAAALAEEGVPSARADNLRISLAPGTGAEEACRAVGRIRARVDAGERLRTPVDEGAIDRLKFSACLPRVLAVSVLEERLTDRRAITAVLNEPVVVVD